MSTVYVSPYLGAAADWLCLLDPALVPPVSWMGGKRRLASRLLRLLGLDPGWPVPAVLGDLSWWGWVWPLIVGPESGPVVSGWLRSWEGEDPRALWFRLRDAGPAEDLAERAAGLLWLQARAASGVPVWWSGETIVSMDGHGRGPYAAWQTTGNPALKTNTDHQGAQDARQGGMVRGESALVQWASTKIDGAGQRQAPESRAASAKGYNDGTLLAGARGDRPAQGYIAGHKGRDSVGGGGIVHPATVADRCDAVRVRLVRASGGQADHGRNDGFRQKHGWRQFVPGDVADRIDAVRFAAGSAIILHTDARTLTDEWAQRLGSDARVYLDPPYQGATGYPAESSRADVIYIARAWAAAGARVVLSEAVGLAEDLGDGWEQHQLRGGKKQELVTTFGCNSLALLGPLFSGIG